MGLIICGLGIICSTDICLQCSCTCRCCIVIVGNRQIIWEPIHSSAQTFHAARSMQLLKWKQEYWMQYLSLTMVSHLIVCLFHSQNLHDNFFWWTDADLSGVKHKPIKFSEEENEESPDSSDDIPSSISKLKRRLLKCTPTRPPSVSLTDPRMTPVTQLHKTCTPRDVLLTGQEWHVW